MQDFLQQAVLTIMLVSMMFAMGLRLTINDLKAVLSNRLLIALTILANFVALPLFALLLVELTGIGGAFAGGILLCAAAPGATMSTILSREARGDIPVAVVLLLVMVFVSAFATPLIATVLFHWAGVPTERMRTGAAILSLLAIQILPLIVGMILHAKQTSLANRLEPIAARFASIMLGVVIVAMCAINYRLVLKIGGLSTLVIAGFVLSAALVGWCFPGPRQVRASACLVTGAQNIALATLLADRYLSNQGLITVLIFGMMTYIVLVPLVVIFRRRLPATA